MDLTRIFTIGGKPGLNKLVAQSKNGVIVESLVDGKRFNASSTSKISSLEDITIFCLEGDKPLKDVLQAIGKANSFSKIEVPIDDKLKETLKKQLPSFDEERVYNSDIKKIFKWYNLLISKDLLKLEEEQAEEQDETASDNKKGDSKTSSEKTQKAVKQATPNKVKAPVKKAPKGKPSTKKASAIKSSSSKKNG